MKWSIFWIIFSFCFFHIDAFAQTGIAEMKQVTQDLKASFFSAVDASLVLAGIFGICGAIRIYNNWQLGKHHFHVDYEVAAWFSASLFMVLLGAILRALFGI